MLSTNFIRTLEYEILTVLEWVILPTRNLMAFLCILHFELFPQSFTYTHTQSSTSFSLLSLLKPSLGALQVLHVVGSLVKCCSVKCHCVLTDRRTHPQEYDDIVASMHPGHFAHRRCYHTETVAEW